MMSFPQLGFRQGMGLPLVLAFFGVALAAQNHLATDTQREAMRKLDFLVGRWRGPVTACAVKENHCT